MQWFNLCMTCFLELLEIFFSNCSAMKNDEQVDLKYAWDVVKGKLMDALNAIEQGGDVGNRVIEFEQNRAKRPLSLYAVAEGPRLRLLWASLQQLEEEAGTVSIFSIYYA